MKPAKMTGFTLLELLISITLFAIMGSTSYQILKTAAQTNEASAKNWQQLIDLQRAKTIIQQDFSHLVSRTVRSKNGEQEFAIFNQLNEKNSLSFSRKATYSHIQGGLQRIQYKLKNNELIRYSINKLDTVTPIAPIKQILLNNINKIDFFFLDQKNIWIKEWPPVDENQKKRIKILPQGIHIVLEHNDYGAIDWVFLGTNMVSENPVAPNRDLTDNTSEK